MSDLNIVITEGSNDIIMSVPGASDFTGLTDTPVEYTGHANEVVVVKEDESGLEFSGFSVEKWEKFTITADILVDGYVTLTKEIIDNQSIRVFMDNVGIQAEQGVDYSVSGAQIFWIGYEFSTLLEVDDKLNIFYY